MSYINQQTYLSGPSLEPRLGKRPDSLVVLLHGYGANGDDLLELAKEFSLALPSTLFVAPNAPFPCEVNPFGYQWFGLQDFDGDRIWQEVSQVVIPFLGEFCDALRSQHHLDWDQIVLSGFSQGAMLALAGGLSFFPAGGVLAYSGAFPEAFGEHIKYKPPVCWIHGDQDEVISLDAFTAGTNVLQTADLPLQSVICPGVSHSICPKGLGTGLRFLKQCLKAF